MKRTSGTAHPTFPVPPLYPSIPIKCSYIRDPLPALRTVQSLSDLPTERVHFPHCSPLDHVVFSTISCWMGLFRKKKSSSRVSLLFSSYRIDVTWPSCFYRARLPSATGCRSSLSCWSFTSTCSTLKVNHVFLIYTTTSSYLSRGIRMFGRDILLECWEFRRKSGWMRIHPIPLSLSLDFQCNNMRWKRILE